jgi:hypothetical protein
LERLAITITSSTAFNAMMGGFAAASGAQLALLFSTAMDEATEEFGKGVYAWAKESILAFSRGSKRKNLRADFEDANSGAQVIFDATLFENTPNETILRVYVPHNFGQWSPDEGRVVDDQTPDELVLDRLAELSTVVLPFVSAVVQTAMRVGDTRAERIIVTGVLPSNKTKNCRWDVILSGIGSAIVESDHTLSHVSSHIPYVTKDDWRQIFETVASRARRD